MNMEDNKNILGNIHSLETFGLVDGPGVRFVVFMQGCAMRCKYCHNPDTWSVNSGEKYTPQQLFDRAYRYHRYWKNNGGITVSGGEPLLQLDFVTEFFRIAKQHGVHTTLDTSAQPFSLEEGRLKKFEELIKHTDLVLLDLKEPDSTKHIELTGHKNENIFQFAKWLSDNGKDMWIRHVLVPELTDDAQGLEELYRFISTLKTVKRVEILPYHTLGLAKWQALGIDYPLNGVRTPAREEIQKAEEILHIVK